MTFDPLYFETYYSDYYKQNPPHKLKSYLDVLLKYKRDGYLLDIGCSYGVFAEIASRHFKCYAMDVDPEILKRAARKIPRLQFIAGSLPDLPFRKVDALTLFDVLEHIDDLEKTMQTLVQSLNADGLVIAVVPVYDGPLGWMVRKLDRDPTHVHKNSRTFWLDLFNRHLELLEWKGIFRKLFFRKYYVHCYTSTFRRISPAVMLVSRKR